MPPAERDLRQVRNVTANFFFWQGLRWIPMGAALIFLAASWTPGLGFPRADQSWWPWAVMAVALWLSTSVIGRYYRRTFGSVRALPELHARRDAIKWLVVYPAMGGAMVIDAKFAPPVFLSGLVFAAGVVAYWNSTGRGRVHYLLAAAALAVLGLLPLTGLLPPGRALLAPLLALLGAIYVVGGLLDHFELMRILGPAGRQEHGGAV